MSSAPAYLVVGQGRAEVVRVEVPACLHVRDADGLTAPDGHATLARTLRLPSNLPVAVGVVGVLHPGDRLLSTACTHGHTHTHRPEGE